MSDAARAPVGAGAERVARAAAWTIVLAAALLRVPFLCGYGIDDDEFYTLRNAEELFATPTPEAVRHFPVSFAVTRFCVELFGDTPLGLRAFPVLAGVLAVVLALRVGPRLVGARAGLAAAALLAAWPWHQYFSGLARYYAPLFLLALFVLDAAWRARERRGAARWVPLSAALVIGVLLHPSLLLVACAPLGLLVAWRGGRLRVGMPLLAAAVLCAGVVAFARFAPADLPVVHVLSGAGGHGYDVVAFAQGLAFAVTPAAAVLAAIGAIALARRDARACTYLVAGVGLPVLVLCALALAGSEVQPRYAMAGMPALVLLAGAGVDALLPRGARGVALAAACALPFAPGLASNLVDGDRHPVPTIVSALRERLRAGDLLIAEGHALVLASTYGYGVRLRPGEGDPPFPRFVLEFPPAADSLAAIAYNRARAWFVVPENQFASPRASEREAVRWLREHAAVELRAGVSRLDAHRNSLLLLRVPREERG